MPVERARGDQQDRVQLRPEHGAELGGGDRLDAVHAVDLAALGHGRGRQRRRRPVEPGRRRLLGGPLPRRVRRGDGHPPGGLLVQPRVVVRERRHAARPAVRQLRTRRVDGGRRADAVAPQAIDQQTVFALDQLQVQARRREGGGDGTGETRPTGSRCAKAAGARQPTSRRSRTRRSATPLLSDRLDCAEGGRPGRRRRRHGAGRGRPAEGRARRRAGDARAPPGAGAGRVVQPARRARSSRPRRRQAARARTSSPSAAARRSSPSRTPTTTTRPPTSRRPRARRCTRSRTEPSSTRGPGTTAAESGFTMQTDGRSDLDVLPPVLPVPRRSQQGATLTAGQPVGLVGSTGRSTGPHLHLQLQPAASYPQDAGVVPVLCRDGVPVVGRGVDEGRLEPGRRTLVFHIVEQPSD